MSFGALLLRIRLPLLKMSDSEFAELIGVSKETLRTWEDGDTFDSTQEMGRSVAKALWPHLPHGQRMELIEALGLGTFHEVEDELSLMSEPPAQPVEGEEPIDFGLITEPSYQLPDRDPLLGLFTMGRVMEKHSISKPDPKVKKILAGNIIMRASAECYLLNELDVYGPDKGSLCMRVSSVLELQVYRLYKDRAIWEEVVKFEVKKMNKKGG